MLKLRAVQESYTGSPVRLAENSGPRTIRRSRTLPNSAMFIRRAPRVNGHLRNENAGFPDLVMIRRATLIFAELKRRARRAAVTGTKSLKLAALRFVATFCLGHLQVYGTGGRTIGMRLKGIAMRKHLLELPHGPGGRTPSGHLGQSEQDQGVKCRSFKVRGHADRGFI